MSKRSKRDSRKNSEKKNDGQQRENCLDEVLSDAFSSDLQVGDQPDPVPSGSVRPVEYDRSGPRSGTLSRRRFLEGMGAAAVAAAVGCGDRSPSDVEDVDGGPDPDDAGGVDADGGPDIMQDGGLDAGQDAGQNEGMLFASNFEGDVRFGEPYGSGTSCYQDIEGFDPTTGFDWANFNNPLNAAYRGHLITGVSGTNPGNIHEYHQNEVLTTTGRHGDQTRAAQFKIVKSTAGANQNIFGYQNPSVWAGTERMYWRYWIRMETDLVEKMGETGWVSFWSWKIGVDTYRLTCQIWTRSDGTPRWMLQGDSGAANRHFRIFNDEVPIPQGEWAKVEVFYDRSGSGRVWTAINGQVLWDYVPKEPLGPSDRRISHGTFLTVRGQHTRATSEREVWIDEFEVWDDFPPDAAPH